MTDEEKLEEIIQRRENGKVFWSRARWDYTEWEEALDELRAWKLKKVVDNI